jgi:hypothetical protein
VGTDLKMGVRPRHFAQSGSTGSLRIAGQELLDLLPMNQAPHTQRINCPGLANVVFFVASCF